MKRALAIAFSALFRHCFFSFAGIRDDDFSFALFERPPLSFSL